jgi:hypothetical protein
VKVDADATVEPTCDNSESGVLKFIADGGTKETPVYTYTLWKNGAVIGNNATGTFRELYAGLYKVVVTDNNCAALAPAEVEVTLSMVDAAPLTVKVDADATVEPTCDNSESGVLKFIAGGGTTEEPVYKFTLWKNGAVIGDNADGEFTGLEAGVYKVVVTDANCAALAPAEVEVTLSMEDATPLTVKVDAEATEQPTCDDSDSGVLKFIAGGGTKETPVYKFTLWKNGAIVGENASGEFENLEAGLYKAVVTDANCAALAPAEVEVTLSIPDFTPWHVIVSKTDPSCANDDGQISLTVTGGSSNPDIQYSWSNGSTQSSIDGLAAGSYTVTIHDANCPAIEPYVLTVTLEKDFNLLEIKLDEKIDPSCPNGADGKIRVSVTGGNGTYEYHWTTVSGSGLVVDAEDQATLSAGIYSLTVTASGDDHSCSATLDNIELKDPFNWTEATISQYISLIGKDLSYKNGDPVPTLNLVSNPLPEGTVLSWTSDNQQIGIATGGDAVIPAFTAYNPNVAGFSRATVTVNVSSIACPDNSVSGTFTITVHARTIDDKDLVVNPVAGQVKCAEEAFDDITFSARRTDGNTLGEVSYIVEFVSGTDVLKGAKLGEIAPAANGRWDIGTITDRRTGEGLYRVIPRSHNSEGSAVSFTLTVLLAPQVDPVPDQAFCNNSPLFVSFTGKYPNTLFDWTADADAQALGIPASGSSTVNVSALRNTGADILTGTITVTPRLGDCPGASSSVTFTVSVLPSVGLEAGYEENVITRSEYCAGDEIRMDVKATGHNLTYQWYKDHILIPGAVNSELVIDAADANYGVSGKYYSVVKGECGSITSKTYDITVKLNIVNQPWNDVLTVNCYPEENGGFIFSEFQWYTLENGVSTKLTGEMKSYLYVPGGIRTDIEYYVVAKTQHGADYKSCPVSGQQVASSSGEISVYPNPVYAGETVNIDIALPESDLATAKIFLVDFSGIILKTTSASSSNQLVMPNKQGIYVIHVVAGNNYAKKFKVIVE